MKGDIERLRALGARAAAALASLALCGGAWAQTVGIEGQQAGWINQLQSVSGLLTTVFVVVGLAITGAGVMALIKYSKDTRQGEEMRKGLAMALLGPALISLPFLVDLSAETVTGQDSDNAVNAVKDDDPLNRYSSTQ